MSTSRKVPILTRFMWGCGGLADNYMFNVFNVLFLYVYVNYFKMDPVLAGIATAIPRFFDAITDPIIGHFSDNFRSKWGRRRPLIVIGAIACAIILPLHWMPPFLSTVNNVWYRNVPFIFISLVGCLYALLYTIYVVPFTALGFEMTDDYDEKTSVLAWRMYMGLIGQCLVPWIYKFSILPIFSNIQQGAIITSCIMGVAIIGFGILPAIGCKENPAHMKPISKEDKKQKQTTIRAFLDTFTNKPFLIVVIGFFIVLFGMGACGTIGGFLNLYVVFEGNEEANSTLSGYQGTMISLICFISMFLLSFISRKTGKREAFITGMVIVIIGQASLWFTINKVHPYLQLFSYAFWALAVQGCWLTLDSMMADICDDDELNTGKRREGLFGAVRGFIQKAANAFTAMIGGFMLKYSGFDVEIAKTSGIAPEIALKMKLLYVLIPIIGCIITIFIFLSYPISRKRSNETRRLLEERAAASEKENTL